MDAKSAVNIRHATGYRRAITLLTVRILCPISAAEQRRISTSDDSGTVIAKYDENASDAQTDDASGERRNMTQDAMHTAIPAAPAASETKKH